jgi:stage II sporulation protein D
MLTFVKHTVLFSVILAVFALIFPIIMSIGNTFESASALSTEPQQAENEIENIFRIDNEDISEAADTNKYDSQSTNTDDNIIVTVLHGDNILEMSMHDYLIGVLSAEMPATFETEALKAQAIAARTYTIYRMNIEPSSAHPDTNVCTDSKCCKAYSSLNDLRDKWGENYENYLTKISNAVTETDGMCIVYDGQPILAVFHSSSSGMTENSENVWGGSIPYLQSVKSMEATEEIPKYTSTATIAQTDFIETMKSQYPDISLPEDPNEWFSNAEYTESGRLYCIDIGGITVKGTVLRSLFDLRSTTLSIEINDNDIVFTTTGYGHGVGMSQYGANSLAEQGYSSEEIIKWYYTGVELENIDELKL